jgi:hypothetical protein
LPWILAGFATQGRRQRRQETRNRLSENLGVRRSGRGGQNATGALRSARCGELIAVVEMRVA